MTAFAKRPIPKSKFTPREAAYDIALRWLRAAWTERTDVLNNYKFSPSQLQKAKIQVAKLHNKLLEQSGLDGINIEED